MRPMAIVIASKQEPLARIVFGANHGLVYLANPCLEAMVIAGETEPVGFPEEDVFKYDRVLYEQLRSAWERGEPIQVSRLDPLGAIAT